MLEGSSAELKGRLEEWRRSQMWSHKKNDPQRSKFHRAFFLCGSSFYRVPRWNLRISFPLWTSLRASLARPRGPPSEMGSEMTDPLVGSATPSFYSPGWLAWVPANSLPPSPPQLQVGGPLRLPLDWLGELTNGELWEADLERHQLEEDKQISSWLRRVFRVGEGQQVRPRLGGSDLVPSRTSRTSSPGTSC